MPVTSAGDDVRARLAGRGEKTVGEDALNKIRKKIAEARDLDAEIDDLTAQLGEKQSARVEILEKELPDLMREHKVKSVTLAASGNLPEYVAALKTEYYASLPADPEKRAAGLEFLVKVWKVPDIIKNAVSLKFGAGEHARAKKLLGLLRKNKYEFETKVSVHQGTLTAELRRRVEAGTPPSPADLTKIGGFVREVVNAKPVKKEK